MITHLLALSLIGISAPSIRSAAAPTTLSIRLDQPGAPVSPSLYGIFFEEINQAGDGGVYGELLQNRGLETANGPQGFPIGWRSLQGATLVEGDGPNAAHTRSIRIEAGGSLANTGFGGVPVKEGEKYHVVLWAKGAGEVGVGFGDRTKFVKLGKPGDGWKKLEKTIRAGGTAPNVHFVINAIDGPVSIGYASMKPEKLWKNRKNGMRRDLAEKVDAMSPAFVRFPGGCYVEGGDRFEDAFDWKASIGPVESRKGVARSMWGYPNTFGLGYHEYLQWCEDLGAAPLFVVNCGINHRQITPMAEMDHWVQYALDAIEYANGPVTSRWGSERAKNGHPKPFNLKYVEIGNENGGGFFGGNAAYAPRYKLIFDAIKAKHPEIVTISNAPIEHPMEMIDEHYYSNPAFFWKNANRYDAYDRNGPKIYVGEYAVTQGCGTGNLAAALGEAAFMTGMERNADVVTMSSYAPLFTSVYNKQWNPDAIVFDTVQSYGTPSYHVQAMFANNRPTRNVKVEYPVTMGEPPKPGGGIGLMTWETKAEFKDVLLTANGQTLYSSAGIAPAGLERARGSWTVEDGTIAQSAMGTNRTVGLKGATAPEGDYTISLKARKLEGAEGFFVVFDMKDGDQLRWNVGGWQNRQTGFERNGTVVGELVPMTVEANRWYDVRIERHANVTRAYLDGKLVQTLVETGAPDLAAAAGIDEKSKELILKVVNGSDLPREASLDILGRGVGATGKAIVLTGPDLMAENSFASPHAIAPVETTFAGTTYTFLPRSVTVLRLPIR